MIKKLNKKKINTNNEMEETNMKKIIKKSVNNDAAKKKELEAIKDIEDDDLNEVEVDIDELEIDTNEPEDDDLNEVEVDMDEDPDEDGEDEPEEEQVVKPVKKSSKKKVVEPEPEDDDEEDEEDEDEEEEDEIPPAVELLKSVKDEKFGPERGRRLFDKKFKKSVTVETKSANRDENLNSIISKLEENGLDYIFDGVKFITEKKKLASMILQSIEESVLDCLYNKKTSFAFLNGRIDITHMDGKFYPKFGKMMKTDVYKAPHDRISLVNCEYNRTVGAIYNVDGTSELTVPCEGNEKSVVVSEDCLLYKKGTKLNTVSGKSSDGEKKKVTKKK